MTAVTETAAEETSATSTAMPMILTRSSLDRAKNFRTGENSSAMPQPPSPDHQRNGHMINQRRKETGKKRREHDRGRRDLRSNRSIEQHNKQA